MYLKDPRTGSVAPFSSTSAVDYQQFLKAGWQPAGSSGVNIATTGAGTTDATGGSIDGVDTTGWSDSMIQSFQAIQNYVKDLQNQGKVVNPNITIDQATIDRFTKQAKTELEPYYGQVFRQAETDIKTGLERQARDYATRERDLGLQYGNALEQTQESYARRGLEFSSERNKAEGDLADQAERSLGDLRTNLFDASKDLGTRGERSIGSSLFPSVNAKVSQGTAPIRGQAGIYGFSFGSPTMDIFSPLGGTTGDLQRQRMTDEEQRKLSLINNERQSRSLNYL